MEHILLIDTTAQTCKVGMVRDGVLLSGMTHTAGQTQAAAINPLIEQLCEQTQVKLGDLAAIAVCSGPGSYTGLRIGMAAAKGICFALNKPLIVQHKLELLAQQCLQQNNDFWFTAVLLTARPGEYFYASYDGDMNIKQAPVHAGTDQVRELLSGLSATSTRIIGDEQAKTVFGDMLISIAEVDLGFWAPWAARSFTMAEFSDVAGAVPFYMKEVFIHTPREKGKASS